MTRRRPADLRRRAAWWRPSSRRKLSRDPPSGSRGFPSFGDPEAHGPGRLVPTTDGRRAGHQVPAKHGNTIGGARLTLRRSRTKGRRRSCAVAVVRSLTEPARVEVLLNSSQLMRHRWNSVGTFLAPRSQRPAEASPLLSMVPATMVDVRTLLSGGPRRKVSGDATIGAPCGLGAGTGRLLKEGGD